ncbi:MAG: hypothetical protein AUF65_01215 [Chloroflexi bacterium 13_1_20CM_50_12]|nr:MAG: hypothetical protein AUF65_01215 [Chloroflexi bacterium 13_1_20CM_50_12]
MSDNIVISTHDDIWEQIVARSIASGDDTWISMMLFLGKTWIVTGNQQENRKNILLSQKEYWKGTYASR